MVNISNSLIKTFVKAYSLPINLYEGEEFNYFLSLYDADYDSHTKWNIFLDAVMSMGNEDKFMREYHRVKDVLIQKVQESSRWKDFQEKDFLIDFDTSVNFMYKSETPFQAKFNGGFFVSVDLEMANFQAMRIVGCTLDCDSFEDFVKEAEPATYEMFRFLTTAKRYRQVIFGNLAPKRQKRVQQHLIADIISQCYLRDWIPEHETDRLIFKSDDEFVMRWDNAEQCEKFIGGVKDVARRQCIRLNIVPYILYQLKPYPYFVRKKFHNYVVSKHMGIGEIPDSIDLKCVPSHFFAECYKEYYEMNVNEMDLTTFHEGRKVRFLDTLF